MHQVKQTPPDRMTPEQRRREIASLLANGLVRLRDAAVAPSAHPPSESKFGLGFYGYQRVHSNPVHHTTELP